MTSSDGHERCGAGKIKAVLERRGVTASGRRIVDIMKRRGMAGAYARRTSEPHKTRPTRPGSRTSSTAGSTADTPRAHLASDLTSRARRRQVGVRVPAHRRLATGASPATAPHTAAPPDLVMAAFATLDFP
ncbi:MAG: hypothetical protein ACLVEF_06525 [Bifidobacterium bifidum]